MSDTIQIFIFFAILGQLYIIHRTYKADHERRKKQSTIEYLSMIRHDYRPLKHELEEKFGREATINLHEMDEDIIRKAEEILSILEHLSVGINTNVYDFDILNQMSGRYLMKIYEKFIPFIKKAQDDYEDTYIEFTRVYKKLEKRATTKPKNIGKIKYE